MSKICARLLTGGALAAGLLTATACQPDTPPSQVPENAAEDSLPLPSLPVAEPPLDRSALILAAIKAGSAAALGLNDMEEQRRLDGKRLEVRIRFGCNIGVGSKLSKPGIGGPFSVRFNEEDRTLRVSAAPDLTLDDPGIGAVAGDTVEAVEGFWMHRPWLLTAGCPVSLAPQAPESADASEIAAGSTPVSAERVGIAQFFAPTDPRTGRRDNRAYEATKLLAAEQQPSKEGYNLVLSGRLRRLADGRIIVCRVTGPDTQPECVASAQFDRVRIETPDGKTTLAEWRN